jgi:centriolar protein POC1
MQGTSHVRKNQAGEFAVEMPPPVAMSDLPPALAATLQHIVGKLDMMTQVIGMVEERLSLTEDKMGHLHEQVVGLVDERLRSHDDKMGQLVARLEHQSAPKQGGRTSDCRVVGGTAATDD